MIFGFNVKIMTALNQVLLLWSVLIWQDRFPFVIKKDLVEEGGAVVLVLDLNPFCTHPETIAPFKRVNLFPPGFSLPYWHSFLETLQINLKVIKIKQTPLFFLAL